jgi:hypothetical protein
MHFVKCKLYCYTFLRYIFTRYTLEKTVGAAKNEQSRDWQHWEHKTQDEDKHNKTHNTEN